MAYVLKLTDPEYSWGYCVKDLPHCNGQMGWFSKHEVFDTEQEALDYVSVLCGNGWFRPEITAANFEIVEVTQYEDLGPWYFTEKEAKHTREAIS